VDEQRALRLGAGALRGGEPAADRARHVVEELLEQRRRLEVLFGELEPVGPAERRAERGEEVGLARAGALGPTDATADAAHRGVELIQIHPPTRPMRIRSEPGLRGIAGAHVHARHGRVVVGQRERRRRLGGGLHDLAGAAGEHEGGERQERGEVVHRTLR
jgi:hypothetical protein